MTLVQGRGGIPRVRRENIDATGRKLTLPFFTNYIVARNKGAVVLRMYFLEEDFTADANYVDVPVVAATDPHGQWAGPAETNDLWFRGVGGASDLELVVFQRRG